MCVRRMWRKEMERVTLGKTGITVNKNGFGALPIQRISTEGRREAGAKGI